MDAEKHKRAIQWLREHSGDMPPSVLIFWANRVHFTMLYDMMVANVFNLDLPLSSVAHEKGLSTTIGLVFCPTLSQFNHDCVPNATIEWRPQGYSLIASEPIQPGEEICFSYMTEPVGLVCEFELSHTLECRYGFVCKCPTHLHDRPLYRKRVKPLTPLPMIYAQNRLLEVQMGMLDKYAKKQEWSKVQQMCEMLAKSFFSIISREARLAYAVSSKFVMSIPYCPPSDDAEKWLSLYALVVCNYCANPAFLARPFFMHVLHTVRKINRVGWNPITERHEHVFAHREGLDMSAFVINHTNLMNILEAVYGAESAKFIVGTESLLFSGLYDYLDQLSEPARQVRERLRRKEEVNNRTTSWLSHKIVSGILDSITTMQEDDVIYIKESADDGKRDPMICSVRDMDMLIYRHNHQLHPDEFVVIERSNLRHHDSSSSSSSSSSFTKSSGRFNKSAKKKKSKSAKSAKSAKSSKSGQVHKSKKHQDKKSFKTSSTGLVRSASKVMSSLEAKAASSKDSTSSKATILEQLMESIAWLPEGATWIAVEDEDAGASSDVCTSSDDVSGQCTYIFLPSQDEQLMAG